ncbi:cytochrome P450 monooxygenase pc-2 [Mycena capillaripes]|nr:cytochrome P450 monooxygenase pc-2 [Mycena capillaripes]
MEIPPGLVYIAYDLPATLVPCALTFTFLTVALPQFDVAPLPLWQRVLAAVIAQPVGVVLSHFYEEYKQARAAAAFGAEQIPVVYSKLPAGISTNRAMAQSFRTGYPGEFLKDWIDQWGNTVMTKIFYETDVWTIEPDHVKSMLATEFDNYWKGPRDTRMGQSLTGSGIFNVNDDMWKFHRGLARPVFNRERISDFALFDKHTHETLSRMKNRLAEGEPVDFQDLISRFTMDSATEFLFGKSIDSMSGGLPYPHSSPRAASSNFASHPSNTFVDAFMQSQIVKMSRGPFLSKWPLREFWSDKVAPIRKIVDDYVDPIITAAVEKKNARKGAEIKADDEDNTFLSHLVASTDDKAVIRDALFNIMIAGRDTTAATLTFALYMLAEHPEIVEKLRKEILDTVGSSKMPDYDDLRNMKYMRAFINETLRLYPPVPFDIRASKNGTTLSPVTPGGKPLYVPPNTTCHYSIFWMHRRTDLWGPDALEFDPDRFLDERVRKYLTPNPYIFLPFNAGPRICLGQQFAYNEASFFLVRLLQNFSDFSLASDAQPMPPPAYWKERSKPQATEKLYLGIHVTMYVKGGLWVRMKEAVPE